MKKAVSLMLIICLAMFSFAACSSKTEKENDNKTSSQKTTSVDNAERTTHDNEVSASKTTSADSDEETTSEETTSEETTYTAQIVVKDYGTITLSLDAETAPITVANFIKLAKSGFYDGLTFHRIISGFMIQGGDPDGNGTGGSDETIKGEFSLNGVENNISHKRGVISMARSSAYDSASSQFFICHQDSTSLDGQYAAFGYVTDGMDVVDKICEDAKPTDSNGTIKAADQPIIEKITILD